MLRWAVGRIRTLDAEMAAFQRRPVLLHTGRHRREAGRWPRSDFQSLLFLANGHLALNVGQFLKRSITLMSNFSGLNNRCHKCLR